MSQFKNPYSEMEVQAFNTDIGKLDYRFIQTVRPQQGTLTITINILWKALVNELKRRNITSWENGGDKLFEEFMSDIRIVPAGEYESLLLESANRVERSALTGGLPYRAVGGTVPETASSDDDRRTESLRSGGSTDEAGLSDIQSEIGRGRKKGTKGKGTKKD